MSDPHYAERRIRDALKKSNGNVAYAKQQLIVWAHEDPKLLQALTRPHLSGIVAYNIERILSGRGVVKGGKKEVPAKPKPAPSKKENFGLELLKAAAGNSETTFGMEAYGPAGRGKRQVSQSHIDAIKAMTRGRGSD